MTLGEARKFFDEDFKSKVLGELRLSSDFLYYVSQMNYDESIARSLANDFSVSSLPEGEPFAAAEVLIENGCYPRKDSYGDWIVDVVDTANIVAAYQKMEEILNEKGVEADFISEKYREEIPDPYEDYTETNRYLIAYCYPKENPDDTPLSIEQQANLENYKKYKEKYKQDLIQLITICKGVK